MKCIIIDDEPLARKGITLLAAQLPYLEVIGEFANPILAHDYLSQTDDVSLIFLDIEMPGLNGLEYLKSMTPEIQVILTTAYPQYALEAFELEVLDYLVKPIKMERFIKAVDRARELESMKSMELQIIENESFIYIKADRKYVKLALKDIWCIKGLKDYVIIHTKDVKYMTAMNVGTIHKQLPSDIFARVSKSYIINVEYIDSIDRDLIYLGQFEIPLGNSYKEDFIARYVKSNLLKR